MKNFFSIVGTAICFFLSVGYLVACTSAFIPPLQFSFISLFGLAFPWLFAAMVLCCFISFFINKKIGFALLIILPFGYYNLIHTVAFNVDQKWQAKKDNSTLRILTWNVEGFHSFLPEPSPEAVIRVQMLQTINELQPDVLCLQEYRNIDNAKRNVSIKEALDSLGYKYSYCSNDKVWRNKKTVHTEGVAIYSKTPFTDSGRVNINKEGKNENLAYTDVLFNSKPLRVFTAHLVSFYLYPDTAKAQDSGEDIYRLTYNRKRSIQYKIRETEADHQNEVAIIRPLINKSPCPVIYCGDLNTTATSYNYHTLKGDMQDAFLAKGFGLGTTFYKILPTLRIDVCLADKKLQVTQCKVEERKLSDHYPVITDVKWK